MYARVDNQAVTAYPYTYDDLRRDNPDTSFPADMSDERLADWGVFPVIETPPPTYDTNLEKLVEQLPQQSGGVWQQVWAVVALTAEEAAAQEEQVKAEITDQVQQRLDTFAQSRYYDNIVSACSYATSQHPQYGPEGRYCVQAREDTWDAWFAIEAEVDAGTRPMPHGYDEIEAELPPLVWPV